MRPPSSSGSSGSSSTSFQAPTPAPGRVLKDVVHGEMRDAFMEAKDRKKIDLRRIAKLVERSKSCKLDVFFNSFERCVTGAMILPPSNAEETLNLLRFAVELVREMQSDYVAHHSSAEDDSDDEHCVHPIVEDMIFPWLISPGVHSSNDANIRRNVTKMVGLLLHRLPENTRIDYGVFQEIMASMLRRIKDKVPAVRLAAVQALERLQDTKNANCPVFLAYKFHCERDQSWVVRRGVVLAMQPSRVALKSLIDRTRDEHHLVRREAFKVVGERVSFRAFKDGGRETLLLRGLGDRCEVVRQAAKKHLFSKWVEECDGVMNVLAKLNMVDEPEAVTLFLQVYFEQATATEIADNLIGILDEETKLIPLEKLAPHNVFYWVEAMKYMRNQVRKEHMAIGGTEGKKLKPFKEAVPKSAESEDDDNEDAELRDEADQNFTHNITRIEPLPAVFSVYFEKFTEFGVKAASGPKAAEIAQKWKTFIQLQLMNSCQYFSYFDTAGRRSVGNALKKLLVDVENTPRSMVKPICQVFPYVYPDHQERVEAMLDVVSDVRVPLEHNQMKRTESTQSDAASRPRPPVPGSSARPSGVTEKVARDRAVKHKQFKLRIHQAQMAVEEATGKMQYDQVPTLVADLNRCCTELKAYEEQMKAEEDEARATATAAAVRNLSPTPSEASDEPLEERKDPPALIRALDVLKEVLFNLHLKSYPSSLNMLQKTFLLECMQNLDPDVRNAAIIVIAQCCELSLPLAKQHLGFMMQITQVDVDFIIDSALRAVFDILLKWGPAILEPDDDERAIVNSSLLDAVNRDGSQSSQDTDASLACVEDSLKRDVLDFLVNMLGHDDIKIRGVCTKGLTKLMLQPSWASAKVLSRLLLTFYNPAQGDLDIEAHQVLAAFFTFFSLDPGNRDILETAVFRTMKAMFNAHVYSLLVGINWDDCASTMLDMMRNMDQRSGNPEDKTGQEALAFKILGEMNLEQNHDEAQGKFYSKVLNLLELPLHKYVAIRSLAMAAKAIKQKPYWTQRPAVVRNLGKFIRMCEKILAKAPKDVFPNAPTDGTSDTQIEADVEGDGEPADSMVAHASRDDVGNNTTVKRIKRRKTIGKSQVTDEDMDAWEAIVERRTTLSRTEMSNIVEQSNAVIRARARGIRGRASPASELPDLDASFEAQPDTSAVGRSTRKRALDGTRSSESQVSELKKKKEDEPEPSTKKETPTPAPRISAARVVAATEPRRVTRASSGASVASSSRLNSSADDVVLPSPNATRATRARDSSSRPILSNIPSPRLRQKE